MKAGKLSLGDERLIALHWEKTLSENVLLKWRAPVPIMVVLYIQKAGKSSKAHSSRESRARFLDFGGHGFV